MSKAGNYLNPSQGGEHVQLCITPLEVPNNFFDIKLRKQFSNISGVARALTHTYGLIVEKEVIFDAILPFEVYMTVWKKLSRTFMV